TLGGFAYTTDYGAGPMIMAGDGLRLLPRCRELGGWRRRILAYAPVGLAAVPCLLDHHANNYRNVDMVAPLSTHHDFDDWPARARLPDLGYPGARIPPVSRRLLAARRLERALDWPELAFRPLVAGAGRSLLAAHGPRPGKLVRLPVLALGNVEFGHHRSLAE